MGLEKWSGEVATWRRLPRCIVAGVFECSFVASGGGVAGARKWGGDVAMLAMSPMSCGIQISGQPVSIYLI